jgi:hypothetical protein
MRSGMKTLPAERDQRRQRGALQRSELQAAAQPAGPLLLEGRGGWPAAVIAPAQRDAHLRVLVCDGTGTGYFVRGSRRPIPRSADLRRASRSMCAPQPTHAASLARSTSASALWDRLRRRLLAARVEDAAPETPARHDVDLVAAFDSRGKGHPAVAADQARRGPRAPRCCRGAPPRSDAGHDPQRYYVSRTNA